MPIAQYAAAVAASAPSCRRGRANRLIESVKDWACDVPERPLVPRPHIGCFERAAAAAAAAVPPLPAETASRARTCLQTSENAAAREASSLIELVD